MKFVDVRFTDLSDGEIVAPDLVGIEVTHAVMVVRNTDHTAFVPLVIARADSFRKEPQP